MWERFMSELREEHLGVPAHGRSEPGGASVASELQAAYREVVARGRMDSRPEPAR
jgi:hypothetical protein